MPVTTVATFIVFSGGLDTSEMGFRWLWRKTRPPRTETALESEGTHQGSVPVPLLPRLCWEVEGRWGGASQAPLTGLRCLSQPSLQRQSSQNIPLPQAWSPRSSTATRNSAGTVRAESP